jgi:putative FmdB family regulatory protein
MPIYQCKCNSCNAEFFAVLEDEKEVFKCPACSKEEIERKVTDIPMNGGCGGSCGGCSAGCDEKE